MEATNQSTNVAPELSEISGINTDVDMLDFGFITDDVTSANAVLDIVQVLQLSGTSYTSAGLP